MKSKGLSDKAIEPCATSDNSPTPYINRYGRKIRLLFNKSCLIQSNTLTYHYGHIVNVYIVYELGASSSNDNAPTLKNCLFGSVTLTKIKHIEKYGYSRDGIGFDRGGRFSFPGGGFSQNVTLFGVDMSSSIHIDKNGKDILILGVRLTQRLEHTLTPEKIYSINFTVTKTKFCLSLHYNGAIYLFVNGTETYKFKAEESEILLSSIYPGNISKDWSVDKMKRTGFTGFVCVDYRIISVDDINISIST